MRESLAIIGALIAVFSTVPYLIDIVKGKTKPNIVSWFTWTLLTGISGSAALVAGEVKTAMLLYAGAIATGLVVLFGLKYGIAKFSRFDIFCQVGAIIGLVLWLAFDSPVFGIVVPLGIDILGMLPTLRHSWLKPYEETWQTFLIGTIAPLFTIVSLTAYNIESLAFPLYLVLANGSITFAILYQRRRQQMVL
jgi:hypothetical protein